MSVSAQPVSTGSQVQLTPIWVLDIVRSIFTNGFLDPATEADNPTGASMWYTEADDGLSRPWGQGDVFVNPPFNNIEPFAERLLARYGRGLLLVPPRTEQRWFQGIAAIYPFLAFSQRIHYEKAGRIKSSCPFPSVMFAFNVSHADEELLRPHGVLLGPA